MSYGKYSPAGHSKGPFVYTADGKIPSEFRHGVDVFDERIHCDGYDSEGFDSYGYSAFDEDGKFVGIGQGVDRVGYTEDEYFSRYMQDQWD